VALEKGQLRIAKNLRDAGSLVRELMERKIHDESIDRPCAVRGRRMQTARRSRNRAGAVMLGRPKAAKSIRTNEISMRAMAYFVPQARLPFKKVDENDEDVAEYLVGVSRLDKEG
jgi:hypothetical protein